jgi:DNA-3-methyladenine glycosylase
MKSKILKNSFFNRDAQEVARSLLGKVLRVAYNDLFLSAQIIETEAYYLDDKASHASLGFTAKRKALFMPAGTIYMYYARGGDSLNFSCRGEGNAVLIKAAYPYLADENSEKMLTLMQTLNPPKNGIGVRPIHKLCAGQTLLCKSLNLKVKQWDQKELIPNQFFIEDVSYIPKKIIQTKRLGIPLGRDEHLLYRFIDADYLRYCTAKPRA